MDFRITDLSATTHNHLLHIIYCESSGGASCRQVKWGEPAPPLLSLPPALSSPLLPSPLDLEVGPLILWLWGLGERFSSAAGPGRAQPPNGI